MNVILVVILGALLHSATAFAECDKKFQAFIHKPCRGETINKGTCTHGKKVFEATGSDQFFEVPADITSIDVKLWGAGGGGAGLGEKAAAGEGGGFSKGRMKVSPRTRLKIIVGKGGVKDANRGGGRSAILIGDDVVISAGGGGSAGSSSGGGLGSVTDEFFVEVETAPSHGILPPLESDLDHIGGSGHGGADRSKNGGDGEVVLCY